MEHVSIPEAVQFIAGVIGSFVGGMIIIFKMKESLPVLAAELVRKVGPLLRELLADEVKDLVAVEMTKPLERLALVERRVDAAEINHRQLLKAHVQHVDPRPVP